MGKIFVVAVSGVGKDFLGIGTQHRADVGEERDQHVGVRGAGLQALGDDDLMCAVDGGPGRSRPERIGWMRLSGSVNCAWARSGGPPSGARSGLPPSTTLGPGRESVYAR
jgi:hypothetical protein